MQTYQIVRYYAPSENRRNEVVADGLTLEEAQAHCSREDTHEAGKWFDGYRTSTAPVPRSGSITKALQACYGKPSDRYR